MKSVVAEVVVVAAGTGWLVGGWWLVDGWLVVGGWWWLVVGGGWLVGWLVMTGFEGGFGVRLFFSPSI